MKQWKKITIFIIFLISAVGIIFILYTGNDGETKEQEQAISEEQEKDAEERQIVQAQTEDETAPQTKDETSLQAEEDLQEPSENETESFPVTAVSLNGGEFNRAVFYSEGRYCYSNGDYYGYTFDENILYGYLSEDGTQVTPCIYSEAEPFSEGLACVCLDGKYGYIGKDGETVLPFIYDQASSFLEGVAYVSQGEEYGLIDKNGDMVLKLTDCDSISSFREGAAFFSRDGRYGYMGKSGRILVEPVYEDAGYFYGGRAAVVKNGFCGVIDKNGREILPTEYFSIRLKGSCIIAMKEDTFYFFDNNGKEVSSGVWDSVGDLEDMFYIYQDGKEGMADENGKIVIEPGYESVRPIAGKELVIVENEDGQYGVLNYEGEVKVPFIYSTISSRDIADGILYVVDASSEKEGCLDVNDFSVKIPMMYDGIYDFTEERAVAELDEKYGVIRYDGTQEMPFVYDRIELFSDGSMAVWTESTAELTDNQGNLIFTGQCDGVRQCGNGYEISRDMEERFIDKQGRVIASGYMRCDSVYGAENTYVLDNGKLLITGEENGKDIEDILLTNQITPKIKPFMELLKEGEITTDTAGPEVKHNLGNMRQCRKFVKLYRIGDAAETMLCFYAEPWKFWNFRESYSALFAVRNGQAQQLIGASECGGSLRGDYVCFWYDKMEKTWKPGTSGAWGGFAGYAYSSEVYNLQKGQANLDVSFIYYNQSANNYSEEDRLQNASLFYDEEDKSCTKETILEEEGLSEYRVDEKRVTKEEYDALDTRYLCYLPYRTEMGYLGY